MPHPFRWLTLSALLALAACGGEGSASKGPLHVDIQGPGDAMPAPGEQVILEAVVRSDGLVQPRDAFTYQWLRDGVPITGATASALVYASVALGQAGSYEVWVTPAAPGGGGGGKVGSKPVQLPTPTDVTSAQAAAVPAGTLTSADFELEPVDHEWAVTSDADDGPGTLREAMRIAAGFEGVNGITFSMPPASAWVISLKSDLPPITGQLRILGPSRTPLRVDGNHAFRPFVLKGGALTLDNFSVVNGLGRGGSAPGGGGGAAGMGGALFVNQGDVILRHMTFEGNVAQGGASFPGSDGDNGGGAGFGGDSPVLGGQGADGGALGGLGGRGYLDGTATTDGEGGEAVGDGSGGGARRGGLLSTPVASWADNLGGGLGHFGAGGGFSVGPEGGGGDSLVFGGGGGGSGGSAGGLFLPGAAGGAGATFGGDGVPGDGVTGGRGGGGGGMGGALFLRQGTLKLVACAFRSNAARPGEGGQAGLGKGGAIFVYPYDETASPDLTMYQAQAYENNQATDAVVEDATYDNNDYYVAQTHLALRKGSPLDLLYRQYRLARRLNVPWRRVSP